MPTVEDFMAKVQEFALWHRREGLEPFKVSSLYDLLPGSAAHGLITALKWPDSWPNSPHAGVYALFGADRGWLMLAKAQ